MGVTIKQEVAQALVNYLATKPYQEVFQLISAVGEAMKAAGAGQTIQESTGDGSQEKKDA